MTRMSYCGHTLLLTPPHGHQELGMNHILLAISSLPASLTSKIKPFGEVVGTERLWTQFYLPMQNDTLLFGFPVALATLNTENDLSRCVCVVMSWTKDKG